MSAANRRDQRLLWIMTALGFAAGLPFSLLIGSLSAWLSNADIAFATIAALSWIGLFYAFKFLWAPLADWLVPPFVSSVGRRRGWMLLCQLVIALCLFALARIDPREQIGLFAAFAALAGFASASQDIVIDAWRIEIANPQAPIDALATRYQFGYRLAAVVGGAMALLLADIWALASDPAAGWPPVFTLMSVIMAAAMLATWAAPEPLLTPRSREPANVPRLDPEVSRLRRQAVIPVAIGWGAAALAILGFMFYSLAPGATGANAAVFRDAAVPWVLAATVGLPLAIAFWLVRRAPHAIDAVGPGALDHVFDRVLAPLVDVVRRYWIWALPVLLLAMTYRISDSIWGSFANPFYLNILGHSNSDVAVASKMVGVLMTVAGISIGGLALALIGRMPALILGGVLAAITNLLYADLARGGVGIDGFLQASGLGTVIAGGLDAFVGGVRGAGATVFDQVTLGAELTRLTAAIAMENLAGGFASAVYTAWLSSIVNRSFAAVQFALLSSLALLVGVIFRPRIGAFIDEVKAAGLEAQAERFHDVFIFATWIGLAAVALCFVEWRRQAVQTPPADPAPAAIPDAKA